MNPIYIIEKKQSGKLLSKGEIEYFIEGYVSGAIPDYQMAAWLMAVYFQGMKIEETVNLTRAMLESGDKINFDGVPGKRVDKHSTGGIGDKMSLLTAPCVAACGGQVPMISGRGLGHTGGTLDKLESIPGFSVYMSPAQVRDSALKLGAALVGQNDTLVPADMKIYALRDVTATVRSLPLITASIISKKAAEGINGLVLDVKTGSGAIFARNEQMEKLARLLVDTGNEFGIETVALLTNMDEPLGQMVGNWLEVKECLDIFRSGKGAEDILELNRALAGAMLKLAGIANTFSQGMEMTDIVLANGKAWAKFKEIVKNQGGDLEFIEHPEEYPTAKHCYEITAQHEGIINHINAKKAGMISITLGSGRARKDDRIDYKAGIKWVRKKGDAVKKGEVIAILYSDSDERLKEAVSNFTGVVSILSRQPLSFPLVYKAFDKYGEHSWEEYSMQ